MVFSTMGNREILRGAERIRVIMWNHRSLEQETPDPACLGTGCSASRITFHVCAQERAD